MSENETGWVVETKPVVSTVVPTREALAARALERIRPPQEAPASRIFQRFSPRRNHWSEVTAYDERARARAANPGAERGDRRTRRHFAPPSRPIARR